MAYEPTHEAPEGGLPAFAEPDPAPGPAARLDAGLDVQVLEQIGDWSHIVCSNGWKAWVDGRRLVARTAPAQAPAAVSAATAAGVGTTETPLEMPATATPKPAVAAAATGPASRVSLGAGSILALIGGILLLLTTWLDWIDVTIEGESANGFAYRVPARFLIDSTEDGSSWISVGALIFVFAVLVGIGASVRPVRVLTLIGGALGVLASALFSYQTSVLVDDVNVAAASVGADLDLGLFDVMTYLPLVAVVAAVVAIVGGVLNLRRS